MALSDKARRPTPKKYSPPRMRTERIEAPSLFTVTCIPPEVDLGGVCGRRDD